VQFDYRYLGTSAVDNGPRDTNMGFVPDASREQPTFFRGELAQKIPFREGISALHDVVVSDMRFKPKDRTEYMAWLANQEHLDWQAIATSRQGVRDKIDVLRAELTDLQARARVRKAEYERAKRQYFNYLYRVSMDAWFVLDPVITVHPDQVFFECFSQDESSYGCLAAKQDVFKNVGDFSCGTTNIDYSQALYDEFQKIREYKTTRLEVDPAGFNVQTTGEDDFREVKIDLPDTWVRGFLQVSSAATFPARTIELHPLDMYNFCTFLRRFKEKHGPRSMRYHLKPGAPIKVSFDPWNHTIECPRSIYKGDTEEVIRIWGRRRIHILERLIPVARKFTLHLLGRGMPSFYVVDLGDLVFTLGLSGWTSNDWSKAGNFDLLAPRMKVDEFTKRRVFDGLKKHWLASPDQLASELGLDRAVVLGALGAYTQAGRVIYDLDAHVYRARELSRDPLPADKLRFSNDREQAAAKFIDDNKVKVDNVSVADGMKKIEGTVQGARSTWKTWMAIDGDQRMRKAECSCTYYHKNRLFKGPCEHMLAVRLMHGRQGGAL